MQVASVGSAFFHQMEINHQASTDNEGLTSNKFEGIETKSVLIPLWKPKNTDVFCYLMLSFLCAFGAEIKGYLF